LGLPNGWFDLLNLFAAKKPALPGMGIQRGYAKPGSFEAKGIAKTLGCNFDDRENILFLQPEAVFQHCGNRYFWQDLFPGDGKGGV
jgi:hypothetical protein